MYTLLSASVLALDLSRHPSGAAVADAADRVLCLTAEDVRALSAACERDDERAGVRAAVLEQCARVPRTGAALRGVSAVYAEGVPGPEGSRAVLDLLGAALLGGLGELLDLLRRELALVGRDLPEAGVQAALDAVAVAWAGRLPDVPLAGLGLLLAPWREALPPVPPALPEDAYGPGGPALRALLEAVPRTSEESWQRVERAHWEREGRLRWSQAMHQACRAADEHDRLLPTARAQLAAARALRLSGVSATRAVQGAAMAVTAAVQATCVRDVLDDECADVLLHAWRAGATDR